VDVSPPVLELELLVPGSFVASDAEPLVGSLAESLVALVFESGGALAEGVRESVELAVLELSVPSDPPLPPSHASIPASSP